MKYIFLGDIYGKKGREVVKKLLPNFRKKVGADCVFANSENLSHGRGGSKKHLEELRAVGVDFFTGGNHTFDDKTLTFDDLQNQIRPANLPKILPGKGYSLIDDKILLINLLGMTFMHQNVANPFEIIEEILEKFKGKKVDIILDFHTEATSEKKALGYFLDGKISCMVGTHTHIQTNDAQILEKGTGYITDLGMNGAFESCLGVQKENVIKTFQTQIKEKFEPEERGKVEFCGVVFETDKENKCIRIENFREVL